LATVSNAHGRRGRWIDMLQDFSFKIVHRPGMRHANADALSQNSVGQAVDDEDFHQEIQDDPNTQHEMAETTEKVLAVRHGQHLEWFGNRRHLRGLTKHRRCCFGINHRRSSDPRHLFMVDVANAADAEEETNLSIGVVEAAENEEFEVTDGEQKPKGGQVTYYNRRQQLELVLAAQELSGIEGCEVEPTAKGDKVEMKGSDIWEDATYLVLLREGMLPKMVELEEGKRARKRAEHYCWKE